jgi:hypothetical protein
VGLLSYSGGRPMSRFLRAVALRARRRRQVGLPRFRRSTVPAVTLRRCLAPAKGGLARPPCEASSHRARSHSRALPPVASDDGAKPTPPFECDLARQDLGTYRMDGADRAPAVSTSAHVKRRLTVNRRWRDVQPTCHSQRHKRSREDVADGCRNPIQREESL